MSASALAALDPLGRETVGLLQRLIRFDTVNPPGNERAAQEHLAAFLREHAPVEAVV